MGNKKPRGADGRGNCGATLLPQIKVDKDRGSAMESAGAHTPRMQYNLCVDGSRPWLAGGYARGKTFQPVPGYLPHHDFTSWDNERVAAPSRVCPSEGRAAEAYDEQRKGHPDWKPGKWA